MRAVGDSHSEKPSSGRWKNLERMYSPENGDGRRGCAGVSGVAGGPGWEKVKGWGRMRIVCARMETAPYWFFGCCC